MIALALTIGLVVGLAAWIARGFTDARGRFDDMSSDLAPLIEAKHSVYRSILDLEEDYDLGKVSTEDQQVLLAQHQGDAIKIIRELNRVQRRDVGDVKDLEDELERDIRAARHALRNRP